MNLRAFIDMPYGVREVAGRTVNFDKVSELLIEPALVRNDCIPFRGDQSSQPGDIRLEMFFELVTADVVVADVSMHNVNVFYELGVRHAASPLGAVMIDGGWITPPPFDTRVDRLLSYDGRLFEGADPRPDAAELETAVRRLAEQIGAAIAAVRDVPGSPVYTHLSGLQPPDARGVDSGKARYFVGQVDRLKERIDMSRNQGWPGDIVTLAESMPVPYQRNQTMVKAAKALIDGRHFAAAKRVLDDVIAWAPRNIEAKCLHGLVLNRLGQGQAARGVLESLLEKNAHNPEVRGILGRVYKDMWRSQWESIEDLAGRRQRAVDRVDLALQAYESYSIAFGNRRDSYYTGINAIGLAQVLRHLDKEFPHWSSPVEPEELAWMAVTVRKAAERSLATLEAAGGVDREELVWTRATLAELALVDDNEATNARAPGLYAKALASRPTQFEIDSMVSQLRLYALLGFREAVVRSCLARLESALAPAPRRFGKVAVCSGHMIDVPTRPSPRFPPSHEASVKARMAAKIDAWQLGPGDLAMCGGARGADILFAELCMERGATVRLLVSLHQAEFSKQSLRLPGDNSWEARFVGLVDRGAEVWRRPDRLGEAPPWLGPFAQTNDWILNTAAAEASGPILAILVWDGKEVGDGPGGTAHFESELRRLGRAPEIIDPMSGAST